MLQVNGAKRTNKGNQAMTSPYIGTIQPFGFNFAPRNWAQCNGQLLSISSNTALFSLLGTQYGGNGTTTFALPNLQGRSMLHQGNLAGGSSYVIGQTGGTESVTLTTANLPPAQPHLQRCLLGAERHYGQGNGPGTDGGRAPGQKR